VLILQDSGMAEPMEQTNRKTPARVRVLREEILGWRPYQVHDSTGMVKLDAMENPFGLPDELRLELGRLLAATAINRYPDAGAARLKDHLRASLGLPVSAGLLLGNGSDELIQILCQAVSQPGAVVMSVDPSFVMYRVCAAVSHVDYVGVPLREDFSLDVGAVLERIEQCRPALIFLAYPNNPTGNLFAIDEILAILEVAPGLVVIDEAYHAFANRSFIGHLSEYPNVIVMRTLSKLGLAGLRLGYLIGDPVWIDELDKLRLPYNINVLSQVAAGFALEHSDVLGEHAAEILAQRAIVREELGLLDGVLVYPSDANFLTFRVSDGPSVFDGLRERAVLIKNLHGAHPLLANCLRVTIGSSGENQTFLKALSDTLSQLGGTLG